MADEAEAAAPAASFVSVLPHALSLNIFARLPVDMRARCMAVCPAWGTTLADVSLWTRVDLSDGSGVTCTAKDAALRGASGLARGGLTALDVSDSEISHAALLDVVTANAGALRELSVYLVQTEGWKSFLGANEPIVELLVDAAPNLSCLHAERLICGSTEARSLLRNEPPFGPLRARSVRVTFAWVDLHAAPAGVPVHEVMADVAQHASLSALDVSYASLDTPGFTAVVDVVLSRRFRSLELSTCTLAPGSVPSLARLLRDGALMELYIDEINEELDFLDAASAPLLCDALRANSTLTSLYLGAGVWMDAAISAALLGALTAHPSLREVACCDWHFEEVFADAGDIIIVGAALGALVAANAPALRSLSLMNARINDAGLRPLLDALPSNRRLTELDIRGNRLTQECVRDVLLPAVRANLSLRSLRMEDVWDSAREAMALVARRRAPRR
jgi:hypothetical protein